MFSLSRGALKRIVDGTNVTEPVMQITSLKSIQNNMDGQTRYKLTLFDGETSHTFGILATQKNYLVDSNELRVGSVIKMEDYAANVLQKDPPKVVIIVVNFEILGEMNIGDDSPAQSATPQQGQSAQQQQQQYQSKPVPNNENVEPNKSSAKSFYNNAANKESQMTHKPAPLAASNQSQMFNNFKVYGISSLNPYQNKWAIKARVTNKSTIRTYTNAKGEGKLFNVELIDNTGEIRANGFNEQCDKFYDLLQIDHVYYISRGVLKTANKQYSKVDNDYEMTFSNDTVIEPCNEDDASSLPHMHINPTKLNDLYNYSANEFIDVIGVVKSSGDVTTIVAKATNRELKKREICLVDDSMHSVTCTLWGKQAEDFDGSDNPVVLLKGAKVGDYGGRTLSVTSTTVFQINPDIPESHSLRGWFDQNGADTEYKNVSNQGAGGGSGSQNGGVSMNSTMNAAYKTLDQTKDERLGMGDKADYFSTRASILYAKKDNSMYMACPGENCNKKVVDQNDGTYRCEKCARNYPNFNWRMILSVNIADFTESNWATCFQETAETILGIDANKLGELKSSNNPQYDEIFANCVFKEFNFKLRAKMETYNDERRVKISAVSVEPIDYVQNSRALLQKIKAYSKSHVC